MSPVPERIDELRELVDTLTEGHLTPAQAARLDGLVVGDPGLRQEYIRLLHMEADLLRFHVGAPPGNSSSVEAASAPLPPRRRFVRRLLATSLSAAGALVLAVTIGLWLSTPAEVRAVARVIELRGTAVLRTVDGRERPVSVEQAIPELAAVSTVSRTALVVLRYSNDSTTVSLGGETEIAFHGEPAGTDVEIRSGLVQCDVAPRSPSRPFRLRTPQAMATVLGTRFLLELIDEETRVAVWEGDVRLTGVASGHSIDVAAGWEARTRADGKPVLEPAMPRLPSDLDFEVPKEVLHTIADVQGELPIDEIVLTEEDERTVFRTDSRFRGHEIDLMISTEGLLLEKEVELQLADLPDTVRTAVAAEQDARRINELIQFTDGRSGRVHYRAWLLGNGREVKLRLGPDGVVLERRERRLP